MRISAESRPRKCLHPQGWPAGSGRPEDECPAYARDGHPRPLPWRSDPDTTDALALIQRARSNDAAAIAQVDDRTALAQVTAACSLAGGLVKPVS